MSGPKKRDADELLNMVARTYGVSLRQVKAEMQASIEVARNNPDPKKQAEFKKYFGDRTPTPEEFIMVITKKLKG